MNIHATNENICAGQKHIIYTGETISETRIEAGEESKKLRAPFSLHHVIRIYIYIYIYRERERERERDEM